MHFDPDARVFVQFGLLDCMILMKEYVSLTTAAMKMGKRDFYRKDASLGNSMLNYPGHVTLTSWIF